MERQFPSHPTIGGWGYYVLPLSGFFQLIKQKINIILLIDQSIYAELFSL